MAKILIAEDNKADALQLQAALEEAGHEVVVMLDGGRAESYLATFDDITLLLTDGQMPHIWGPELIKHLRTDAAFACYKSLPIIASSGDSSMFRKNGDEYLHIIDKKYGPGPDYKSVWNIPLAVKTVAEILARVS